MRTAEGARETKQEMRSDTSCWPDKLNPYIAF